MPLSLVKDTWMFFCALQMHHNCSRMQCRLTYYVNVRQSLCCRGDLYYHDLHSLYHQIMFADPVIVSLAVHTAADLGCEGDNLNYNLAISGPQHIPLSHISDKSRSRTEFPVLLATIVLQTVCIALSEPREIY